MITRGSWEVAYTIALRTGEGVEKPLGNQGVGAREIKFDTHKEGDAARHVAGAP